MAITYAKPKWFPGLDPRRRRPYQDRVNPEVQIQGPVPLPPIEGTPGTPEVPVRLVNQDPNVPMGFRILL